MNLYEISNRGREYLQTTKIKMESSKDPQPEAEPSVLQSDDDSVIPKKRPNICNVIPFFFTKCLYFCYFQSLKLAKNKTYDLNFIEGFDVLMFDCVLL